MTRRTYVGRYWRGEMEFVEGKKLVRYVFSAAPYFSLRNLAPRRFGGSTGSVSLPPLVRTLSPSLEEWWATQCRPPWPSL